MSNEIQIKNPANISTDRVISGRLPFVLLYIKVAIVSKIIVNQNVNASVICITFYLYPFFLLVIQIAYAYNILMSS
tara:strand:+ start:249 stop:476 length:228 start_codon:yes stop_codon:yes gene_type:complete